MIYVTRLDKSQLVINAELVELVESTPDTIVTLTTGKKYMVRESVEEIIARIIQYRRRISPFFETPSDEKT